MKTWTGKQLFLYIDPLKQGLKQQYQDIQSALKELFLYIDPLKQGLKQYMPLVEILFL